MERGNLLPYFTLEEVGALSGMTDSQLLRLGISGALRFSILENTPTNYERKEEREVSDGIEIRTSTKESSRLFGDSGPSLKLRYVKPEDIANIVANEAPSTRTLIRELYKTRELRKKEAKYLLNCPMKITAADLRISREEWELFKEVNGKCALKQNPLASPERVTLVWLARNVSVSLWYKAAAVLFAVFMLGAAFAQTGMYSSIEAVFSAEASKTGSRM